MLSITAHSNSKLMKIITLLPSSWGFLESVRVGNELQYLRWNIFKNSNWTIDIIALDNYTLVRTIHAPHWFNKWCNNHCTNFSWAPIKNEYEFTFNGR